MTRLEDALLSQVGPTWYVELREEFDRPYFQELCAFVRSERNAGKDIYPPSGSVFRAFQETPFPQVQVVVVGQDPYHGPGQAHGLSFSVEPGVPLPPSLRNIYKELHADLGVQPAPHGCLLPWAQQGVLLLNATLTVRRGTPGSHLGKGWERFTDTVIARLWARSEPLVFILWGRNAQKKCDSIMLETPGATHLVLRSAHPSPLSAYNGFFGSRPFSQVNKALQSWGRQEIQWQLD